MYLRLTQNLLYSWGWLWTSNLPASVSWTLHAEMIGMCRYAQFMRCRDWTHSVMHVRQAFIHLSHTPDHGYYFFAGLIDNFNHWTILCYLVYNNSKIFWTSILPTLYLVFRIEYSILNLRSPIFLFLSLLWLNIWYLIWQGLKTYEILITLKIYLCRAPSPSCHSGTLLIRMSVCVIILPLIQPFKTSRNNKLLSKDYKQSLLNSLKEGNRRYADAQTLKKMQGLKIEEHCPIDQKLNAQTELMQDIDSNLNVDFFWTFYIWVQR